MGVDKVGGLVVANKHYILCFLSIGAQYNVFSGKVQACLKGVFSVKQRRCVIGFVAEHLFFSGFIGRPVAVGEWNIF